MPNSRPPFDHLQRTLDQYAALGYPAYRWVYNEDTPPWAPVSKALADSKVGLVASGGIYPHGQIAFHHRDDISLRMIRAAVPKEDLRATHFAYDLTDARRDPNVVFPRDTLNTLADGGVIGVVSDMAYTFMGGIYSSRKVRDIMAPEITRRMQADEVDLAILVPV